MLLRHPTVLSGQSKREPTLTVWKYLLISIATLTQHVSTPAEGLRISVQSNHFFFACYILFLCVHLTGSSGPDLVYIDVCTCRPPNKYRFLPLKGL